jgi:hypothetical protein
MELLATNLALLRDDYGGPAPFSLDLLNFGRFGANRGFYSPADLTQAQKSFNANCGPASFGAIRRSKVTDVMRFFSHFPMRDWTTVGDMRLAFKAAGMRFADVGIALPAYGVALLQLRINDRPLHPLYSLSQTHWVGVCNGCFYDINWGGWLTIPLWQELVLSQLVLGARPVCGWEVRNGIEVLEQELVQIAFGFERIGPSP